MPRFKNHLKKLLYGHIPGFRGRFPYFGTDVYFPANSLVFSEVCRQGIYELENVQLIAKLLRPKSCFFDVGANIGLTSVPMLRAHPDLEIVCFEPSPNSAPWLEKTIENSKHRDRWRLIKKAVGASEGASEFCVSPLESGLFDSVVDTARGGGITKIQVEMTTLDAEWEALGRPDISVVKIDVEGWEVPVIEGSSRLMAACRPRVLLEWNGRNLAATGTDPCSLLRVAEKMKYRVLTVPDLIEVTDGDLLELQMTRTENFLLSSPTNL